jgi:hypothetical protein
MTPKEKAKELVDKFIPHTRVFHEVLGWEDYFDSAKQCALIAVDEILEVMGSAVVYNYVYPGVKIYAYPGTEIYWQEVKQEIEKL